MSVFVHKHSRVIIQGFTGQHATFHAEEAIQHGTTVVGGVTPGKGGMTHLGLPVFDTVHQAVQETGADVSGIFVPPPFAADAIMEALEAGVGVVVVIADGIPVQDMVQVKRYAADRNAVIIGPNTPGIITPEACKVGIMPSHIYTPGRIGVVSRSGTLNYEAVQQMSALGMGQSTSVGIGGDRAARLRGRSGDGCGDYDRRDRRPPGSRCGALGAGKHEQAHRRLRGRRVGATRTAHGTCGRDHFR